ncbi:MAG TPA: hypothetical protein VFW40_10665 [Capsulimonadaceae bacterium]|nr:hypothetical protein [Capsulimonadaceae bacterium]
METSARGRDPWLAYKAWFWAAAGYNAVWGAVVGLRPDLLLRVYGLDSAQQIAVGPLPAILASCIGMFVGVYAIGYACVAIAPRRFWPFAAIGLAGKVLGPAGWAVQHIEGHLAWPSIWVNITNDFLWWPAFICLLIRVARTKDVDK